MKVDEMKERIVALEKINKRLNHQIAGLKTNNRELTIERNRLNRELQEYKRIYAEAHQRKEAIRRKAIGGTG